MKKVDFFQIIPKLPMVHVLLPKTYIRFLCFLNRQRLSFPSALIRDKVTPQSPGTPKHKVVFPTVCRYWYSLPTLFSANRKLLSVVHRCFCKCDVKRCIYRRLVTTQVNGAYLARQLAAQSRAAMNYSHPRNEEKHFGFPFRTVPKVVNDNDNKSNNNNKNNFNYLLA